MREHQQQQYFATNIVDNHLAVQLAKQLHIQATTTTTTSSLSCSYKEKQNLEIMAAASPPKCSANPYANYIKMQDDDHATSPTTPTTLQIVSSSELIDWLHRDPLTLLILDVRSDEQTSINKLLTAVPISQAVIASATSAGQIEQSFVSFEHKIYFRQREFCKVVIYDDSIHAKRLFGILHREGVCKEMFVVEESFDDICDKYPLYCEQGLGDLHKAHELGICHTMSNEERLKLCHARLFRSFSRNIDCELPSKILDHLYLGSAQNSVNKPQLQKLKVTYILNTAKECKNHYPAEFTYHKCSLVDDEKEDVTRFFNETHDMLEKVRISDSRALVHCMVGISRSVSIVVACMFPKSSYNSTDLMKHKQFPLVVAYKYVREKRPIVDIVCTSILLINVICRTWVLCDNCKFMKRHSLVFLVFV